MKLSADTVGPVAPVPMPPGAWPEGDPGDALLQLDFDAAELPRKRSGRLEWMSPPASIKEAIVRWLDEQL